MVVSSTGAVAAALVAALLGLGAAGAGRAGWARSWLVVLHEVNAAPGRASLETLRGVRAVDIALLLLSAGAYAGTWPRLGTGHPVWLAVAVAQPLVGVPLLLATQRVGRSGLMGGALVLSVLMVVEDLWPPAGWLGVAASSLLLVGDLGTTSRGSRPLASVIAVGYGALFVWFWLLALVLA